MAATQDQNVTGAERCAWPTTESLEEAARRARRAATEVRNAAEDLADGAALQVRRHPFAAVGLGLLAGIVGGTLFGLGVGRFTFGKKP